MSNINRIKVVLVENDKTNKWLAEQLGKDPATVSKWCTNIAQPSLETLGEIAKVLGVDTRELIVPTDPQKVIMSLYPDQQVL
jgi:putative transcriptional regulator